MPDEVFISDDIAIPLGDIELTAVRSRGAGGQNVNKLATAVHLRFDIHRSAALPDPVKERLLASGDRRITADGVLVIKAQEHRTRARNRQAALDRMIETIRAALAEPKPRKPTRPSQQSRRQRLADKRRRGQLKQTRGRVTDD